MNGPEKFNLDHIFPAGYPFPVTLSCYNACTCFQK